MTKSLADIIDENDSSNISLFSSKGFTLRKIQICDNCQGEGYVIVTEDLGHSKGLVERRKVCRNCKTSGRIEVFVTIVRKPFKPKKNE